MSFLTLPSNPTNQQYLVINILASAKSEYYNKKIKACKGNQRTIFSVVN